MNVENIRRWASIIEKLPHVGREGGFGFNMATWWAKDGTPHCIAGHIVRARVPPNVEFDRYVGRLGVRGIIQEVMRELGISETEALELCIPRYTPNNDEITPAEAASTLRRLADKGEVVWIIKGGCR
jgi:hypothetical protein